MDKTQQIEEHQQIQKYLASNQVYQTLQKIIQRVIIQKPSNPIDFMINQLSKPQRQIIFVVSPPSFRLHTKVQEVLKNIGKQYSNVQDFNCGDFINQEIKDKLSEQSKKLLQQNRLIQSQDSSKLIIPKIKQLVNSSKSHVIIQGFPKTLEQALQLQKINIYPSKVLFVNVNFVHLSQLCQQKTTQSFPDKSEDQQQFFIDQMQAEYLCHNTALKQFYSPNFLQIDASKYNNESLYEQLKRNLTLRIGTTSPKKTHQIVIMGSPLSGRTTLGKNLAKKLSLVYVSTSELIAQEIRRDTINGRRIKQSFLRKQLLDSFVIEKMIQERICKRDCQMQGFILQGYPKNKDQWKDLRNLRVRPTFFIAIDANMQLVNERQNRQGSIQKRFQKWNSFREQLKKSNEKIFWLNPTLGITNMVEEVGFQIERRVK